MPDQQSNAEEVRARFAATAPLVAEHAQRQIEVVREQVRSFIAPTGDERALDAGTGAGTLALALAPLVREVVGVDIVPELLERARAGAPDNVTFVEGDVTKLPFDSGTFDLSCSRRTLHHIARPERAVAELARVTAPGGQVFVDDQIAPGPATRHGVVRAIQPHERPRARGRERRRLGGKRFRDRPPRALLLGEARRDRRRRRQPRIQTRQ